MHTKNTTARYLASSAILLLSVLSVAPVFAFDQHNVDDVAAQVRSAFAYTPVMVAVAKCESGFREFDYDTSVLRGGDGSMVGIFQIDENTHRTKALSLGFDIDTVEGNIAYARYLYNRDGTDPWMSTFPCWGSTAQTQSTSTVSTASTTSTSSTNTPAISSTPADTVFPTTSGGQAPLLSIDLSLGMIDPQAQTLQRLLNQLGFTVADSGPGSPGNETTKFGALTRAALRRFQCAQAIACSGSEGTTGYGFLNAPTRTTLLSLAAKTPSLNVAAAPSTGSTNSPQASGGQTPTTSPNQPVQPNQAQAAEITRLQAQIAELTRQIADLTAELALRNKQLSLTN